MQVEEKSVPNRHNYFRKVLLSHVNDTAQTFSFSHQLKCLVYIFKCHVVCDVLIDLDFLYTEIRMVSVRLYIQYSYYQL